MQRLFLLCICFLITNLLFAQKNIELEKRNGFKDIKLGMAIDSIKGAKFKKDFKEKEEFDAKLFEVDHPDYKKIGEVAINKVELKTYKNLIYEITVITAKDPRLMKALESIYGKSGYDQINETYFWNGQDLTLKFKSHSKNQLEMVYISFSVFKMMKEDKDKKIVDIADDF